MKSNGVVKRTSPSAIPYGVRTRVGVVGVAGIDTILARLING